MSPALHFRPGSEVPEWVEAIERSCFGEPWGPLGQGEHIWAVFPAGFARWRIVPAVQEGELLRLGVAEAQRRTGQGRALLRHSQEQLARYGIRVLHLEVRVSNTAARKLYESEGWTLEGLRRRYYRNGEDAAVYRRET